MGANICFRGVRSQFWIDTPEWLKKGEAAAECLKDLRTKDDTLSVFLLPAEEVAGLSVRVAAAMAAKKDRLDSFGYVLLDAESLTRAGLELEMSSGGTPDEGVNAYHANIVRLSTDKMSRLAVILMDAVSSFELLFDDEVGRELADGVRTGRIRKGEVNGALLRELVNSRLLE